MPSVAASPRLKNDRQPRPNKPEAGLPWRDRPLLTLQLASEVAGVSVASLYRFVEEKKLVFRRLGGRTLVVTASLIALVDGADEWTPSKQTAKACAARAMNASFG